MFSPGFKVNFACSEDTEFVASVTVTVKLNVPDTVGTPVIVPELAFNVKPAGKPPETLQL
jgi:hypothetical protein